MGPSEYEAYNFYWACPKYVLKKTVASSFPQVSFQDNIFEHLVDE